MEPDYDITLNSIDGEVSDASSKSHFFNSLGLGEPSFDRAHSSGGRPEGDDDGVVLSSLPDGLGFPMERSFPARNLSQFLSPQADTDREDSALIDLPSREAPGQEMEPVENAVPDAVENRARDGEPVTPPGPDLEAILHLCCPECDGALVIKRRHLGVEGACVWCHTPLVAAESVRDGAVRVFPILGVRVSTPTGTTTEEETGVVPASPAAEPMETAGCRVESHAIEGSAAGPVDGASAWADLPGDLLPGVEVAPAALIDGLLPQSLEESTPAFPGFADGFPGSDPNLVAEKEPASVPIPQLVSDIGNSHTGGMPDLDALYQGGGAAVAAGSPVADASVPSVMGFPTHGYNNPSPIEPGFGSFLQSTKPISEPEPSPGFATPTLWGPPANAAPSGSVAPQSAPSTVSASQDETPALLPSGFLPPVAPPAPVSAPSWEAAFGLSSPAASARMPVGGDPFASAFGSVFGTGSAETLAERNAFSDIPTESPSLPPQPELPPVEDSGFFSPTSGFSASSLPWSDRSSASPEPVGEFGQPAPLAWGRSPEFSDEAPSTLTPLASTAESEIQPSPFLSVDPVAPVRPFEAGRDSQTSTIGSPAGASVPLDRFPSQGGTPALPPPLPATATAPSAPSPSPLSADPVATAPAASVITPLSPEKQVKPKVRKGFVVLMVVIVGFACGAALASYVLPVERYVEVARSFMETKFAKKATISTPVPLPAPLATPGTSRPTPPAP
jgi:hypothetical protein